MYTHPLHKDPSLESLYNLCEKKAQVMMKFPEVDNFFKNYWRGIWWFTIQNTQHSSSECLALLNALCEYCFVVIVDNQKQG